MNKHKQLVTELINAFAPMSTGVEIGVETGETSKAILETTITTHLYLIDPWIRSGNQNTNERHYQRVCQIVDEYPERATIIKKKAEDATDDVPNELGFIFVDGDHHYDYVMKDLNLWVPKVRSGGLIMGHDWSRHFPEVVQAVMDFEQTGAFVHIGSLKQVDNFIPAPSDNPIIMKSWPGGNLWWTIKKMT